MSADSKNTNDFTISDNGFTISDNGFTISDNGFLTFYFWWQTFSYILLLVANIFLHFTSGGKHFQKYTFFESREVSKRTRTL